MMNVGIIGCGKIAQVRHAPEYAAHPGCRIRKLFDVNKERAAQVAAQYGAEMCESYEQILQDNQIDAVSVCVINKEHARFTIEALNAGKHVICEKPMAVTLEECRQMVEAAERNDRVLLIAQNQRLLKSHQLVRNIIRDGQIGDVLTFRLTFGHSGPDNWSVDKGNGTWFFRKNVAAFGVMNDLGIHKLDLLQYLLDDVADSVMACTQTLDKRFDDGSFIEVEDNAICLLKMKKRALGTVAASWTYYGEEDNSSVICGTKGRILVYADPEYSIILEKSTGERIYMKVDEIQTNKVQTSSGVINEFYEAVVEGKESVLDCRKVIHSMETAFACIESADKGHWVEIVR